MANDTSKPTSGASSASSSVPESQARRPAETPSSGNGRSSSSWEERPYWQRPYWHRIDPRLDPGPRSTYDEDDPKTWIKPGLDPEILTTGFCIDEETEAKVNSRAPIAVPRSRPLQLPDHMLPDTRSQSSISVPDYRPAERPVFLKDRKRNKVHYQPPADDPDEVSGACAAEQKAQQTTAREETIQEKSAQRKQAEDRRGKIRFMIEASIARRKKRLADRKAAAQIPLGKVMEQRRAAPQGDKKQQVASKPTTLASPFVSRLKRRIKLKLKVAHVDLHDLDEATRHDQDIQALLDMALGWSREQVAAALEAAQWSRDRAANFLLMGGIIPPATSNVSGYVPERREPLTAARKKARTELLHQLAQGEMAFLLGELMHRDEHGHLDVDAVDATTLARYLNLEGLRAHPEFYSSITISELRTICRDNGVFFELRDAKTLNQVTEEHVLEAQALTEEYDMDIDDRTDSEHIFRRLGFDIPHGPCIVANSFLSIIKDGLSASMASCDGLPSQDTGSSETRSAGESDRPDGDPALTRSAYPAWPLESPEQPSSLSERAPLSPSSGQELRPPAPPISTSPPEPSTPSLLSPPTLPPTPKGHGRRRSLPPPSRLAHAWNMSDLESGALELPEVPEKKVARRKSRNDGRGRCMDGVVTADENAVLADAQDSEEGHQSKRVDIFLNTAGIHPSSTKLRKTKSDGDDTSRNRLLPVQFCDMKGQGKASQKSSRAAKKTTDQDKTLIKHAAATALLRLGRSNEASQQGASLSPKSH